jgi:type IV pilus assembly protein PilA
MEKGYTFKLNSSNKSFTLVELIIVVIIVGILAAVGLTQYNLVIEKMRTAEAKTRIGVMRNLAYQYYQENGTVVGIQDADVGVVGSDCSSTDFYRYWVYEGGGAFGLVALRCTSDGKTPNATRAYTYFMHFYPATGQTDWHCYYVDDVSPCFGLTTG